MGTKMEASQAAFFFSFLLGVAVGIGAAMVYVVSQKEESPDLKVYDAELLDENDTSSTT